MTAQAFGINFIDLVLFLNPRSDPIREPSMSIALHWYQESGFDAALTPTGTTCHDAWITCAALSQVVDRLRFLVAFRPGSISPTLAAQQAATFQRHAGGPLALNIVTGGDDEEQPEIYFGGASDAALRSPLAMPTSP
jgi:alkanesulfonate monooxygenase